MRAGLADFAFAMQGLGTGPGHARSARTEQTRALAAADVADRNGRSRPSPCRSRRRGRMSRRWPARPSPDGHDHVRLERREDLDLERRDRGPLRRVLRAPARHPASRGCRLSSSRRVHRGSRSPNGSTRSRRIPWRRLRFRSDCRVPVSAADRRLRARASGSPWRRSTCSARPWARRRSAWRGGRSTRRWHRVTRRRLFGGAMADMPAVQGHSGRHGRSTSTPPR